MGLGSSGPELTLMDGESVGELSRQENFTSGNSAANQTMLKTNKPNFIVDNLEAYELLPTTAWWTGRPWCGLTNRTAQDLNLS